MTGAAYTLQHLLLCLVLALALSACASASSDGSEGSDSGESNMAQTDTEVTQDDATEADTSVLEDSSPPTDSESPPEDSSTMMDTATTPMDTAMDTAVVEDEPDEGCPGDCCPGDIICVDDNTVATCMGSMWSERDCPGNQECRDSACREPIVSCEPGTSECVDPGTSRTCNGAGDGYTTRPCGTGVCMGGSCSSGEPIAAACETDEVCAGRECLCRGDETCPSDLQTTLGAGYCTTLDCAVDGCREDEVCMDFSTPGLLTGGNHCVTGCNDCAVNDYTCRPLPIETGQGVAWSEGCFPRYPRRIGRRCANDDDCMGGTCLRDSDAVPNGYCTFNDCGPGRACPTGSVCYPQGDRRYCARLCNGGPSGMSCPEEVENDHNTDVSCIFFADDEGELIRVCAPQRLE